MSAAEPILVRTGEESDDDVLAALQVPSLPKTMADVTAYSNSYRTQKHSQELYLKPYWKTLLIAAIYYVIPSMEFVIYQYTHLDDTICYYNEMCMRPALGFVAFNNVISNLVYITLGLLWMFFVWLNSFAASKIPDTVGLGRDFSLYYCMGGAMVYEGIFSGLYHICPSPVNFQFDTAFMIIGGGLTFLTLYAKRHPIYLAGASRVFAFFALFIILDTLSLLKLPSLVFWTIAIVFLTYLITQGSIYLYYHRVIRIWRCEERYCQSIVEFYQHLRSDNWAIRHKPSFFMLLTAITLNYAYFFWNAYEGFYYAETQDFPFFLLSIIIGNCFIYLAFYIIMKHVEGEKVYFVNWMLVLLNLFFWGSGYYYYQVLAVTNKFLTPAESSQLNKPCALFDYFDYHDAWHMLSGLGLFTLFCLVFSLDIDIRHTPRENIKVF